MPRGKVGRNYVVSLHNDYRSQLTQGKSANLSGENMPTGKNIKQMSYSVDIENIAQQWADKCTYSHSGIYVYGECFSAFPAEYNESNRQLILNEIFINVELAFR
uniref:SCP domain-containing protein n=1 Tax=Meloidogyne javanica TaxID=6303 RepID=A0A915LEJ6_MELJA